VQLAGHALVMLWLVNRLAPLRGRGLGPAALKAALASLLMAALLWPGLPVVQGWFPAGNTLTEALTLGLLALAGGGAYLLALILLRAQELTLLAGLLKRLWPDKKY
jgi:peptidoglycan biosynthesis protein MviN/MurJ (putative lipid II flippase)